jgi:hypothetical protein
MLGSYSFAHGLSLIRKKKDDPEFIGKKKDVVPHAGRGPSHQLTDQAGRRPTN